MGRMIGICDVCEGEINDLYYSLMITRKDFNEEGLNKQIIELDVCENCYTKVMSMLNDLVPEPKPRPEFEVVMSIHFDDEEYTKEEEEKMNQEVIDALFPVPIRFHYFKDKENVPEACKNCHNHPINGGSGVCLCDAEVE